VLLVGVTYFFSIAAVNGTIDCVIKGVLGRVGRYAVALASRRSWAGEQRIGAPMADESTTHSVAEAMRAINQAWLEKRVDDMAPALDPDIVMVFPGFSGRMRGREQFLAGFRDFVQSATIDELHDRGQQIDVVGDNAVVMFPYEMLYSRSGERYRATGRDLWVFQKRGSTWVAVWRTMMDLSESPETPATTRKS